MRARRQRAIDNQNGSRRAPSTRGAGTGASMLGAAGVTEIVFGVGAFSMRMSTALPFGASGIFLPGAGTVSPLAGAGVAPQVVQVLSQQASWRWNRSRNLLKKLGRAHGSQQVVTGAGAQQAGLCSWHVGLHVSHESHRLNIPRRRPRSEWHPVSHPQLAPQVGPQLEATTGAGAAAAGGAFLSPAWPTSKAEVTSKNAAFTRIPPKKG
jgi:hypothetical protein